MPPLRATPDDPGYFEPDHLEGESIGSLLGAIRQRARWPQRTAAIRAGVARTWLSGLENEHSPPRFDLFVALLEAYELRMELVPAWDVRTGAPAHTFAARLDREWLTRAWEVAELERLAMAPDSRRWPYSGRTNWGQMRRDAPARRRRWLRARLAYLARLRERVDELERELQEALQDSGASVTR